MASSSPDLVYPSLELAEHPYPFYELLRAESPVYKVPGRDEYLVARHVDVLHVLKHPDVFSNALARQGRKHSSGSHEERGEDASTIASDPPEHKAKRALCFRGFTPGRLRDYEPRIEAIVDDLIDEFVERGEVEFVSEFANPLPILVFCALFFGDAREDYDRFRRWALLEGSGIRYLPAERQDAARKRGEGMKEYLAAAILDRHETPRDDVLSEVILAQVERDGELRLDYLRAEAGLLLAGGFVTTAHMIASAMLLMLRHPEQMQLVRADHSRIKRMLEEALRVESPVQWQPRVTKVDTELAGVDIPAGSLVLVLLASANRDESTFEEAADFDIARPNTSAHVAFGYGAHFCLGAPLGRLEGRIAFERLLTRLDAIRAVDEHEVTSLESTLFRGPKALRLQFEQAAT